MSSEARPRVLPLVALAGLGVLLNVAAPTVFFDSQLMLGLSPAVLALLQFGWWGVAVGVPALAVTVWRWGHAFELLNGLAFLSCLAAFLSWHARRGGRADDGRLVLVAVGYWLLLGLPLEILLFSQRMGVSLVKATGLGLKEAITGVLSAVIGLLLFLLLRLCRRRGQIGQLSARGITFAAVLLAVTLPGVLITFILSGQLKVTALEAQRDELAAAAALVRQVPEASELIPPSGVALRWPDGRGGRRSSDPGLFARLDQAYVQERSSRARRAGLEILRPSRHLPVLRADQQAYWRLRPGEVEVVTPAEPLIRRLDYELQFPSFSLLAGLLLLGALLAELLATAVDRQFRGVIRPLRLQVDATVLPELGGSVIRELQQLVELVNSRARRTCELSASLQQARDELAQAALAITEAIPVGTYTMVLRPGAELAHFSFMSERFLEICGLERQVAAADPLQAFACVHPDDYDAWLALNAETFARKLPFKGRCRVLVKGQVRWIQAESVPRDLADGSTVWEGVIADITDQVEALQQVEAKEQQLRRILDTLPIPVGCNRLDPAETIVFLNRCFQQTFGYTGADLPNVPAFAELAYPDPAYRQQIGAIWAQGVERALQTGEPLAPLEVEVLCRDGTRRQVIFTAALFEDLMVAAFVDVTERKRAEAALEEAYRREAELRERQRRELESKLRTSLTAAAVAHEINQPLSSILINAQLLQDRIAALPAGDGLADLQPLLAIQAQEAERIVGTIEKMRMLLRNVQTEPQRVDLCAVIDSALLYLRGLLEEAGIAVHTEGLETPCWLEGDGGQLQIAVANLIRNAVEALRQAGVGSPRLELRLERQPAGPAGAGSVGEGSVLLRVGDNGPGFAPATLESLPLASTKPSGTGIGLYVARTTAENHGGSLAVCRSASLGGAEVVLQLPAV